jgi:hypothetical protein
MLSEQLAAALVEDSVSASIIKHLGAGRPLSVDALTKYANIDTGKSVSKAQVRAHLKKLMAANKAVGVPPARGQVSRYRLSEDNSPDPDPGTLKIQGRDHYAVPATAVKNRRITYSIHKNNRNKAVGTWSGEVKQWEKAWSKIKLGRFRTRPTEDGGSEVVVA